MKVNSALDRKINSNMSSNNILNQIQAQRSGSQMRNGNGQQQLAVDSIQNKTSTQRRKDMNMNNYLRELNVSMPGQISPKMSATRNRLSRTALGKSYFDTGNVNLSVDFGSTNPLYRSRSN